MQAQMEKPNLLEQRIVEIQHRLAVIGKLVEQIHETKHRVEQRIYDGATPTSDINARLLSTENIEIRQAELAESICEFYQYARPLLITVLDGAATFSGGLQKELMQRSLKFDRDTIKVKSYEGTTSHTLKFIGEIPCVLGRHVLLVEDVFDTGKTYHELRRTLIEDCGAQSVGMVALVNKQQERPGITEPQPFFVGFAVPAQAFILQHGMDYEGLGRNSLPVVNVNPDTLYTAEESNLVKQEKALNEEFRRLKAEFKALSAKKLDELQKPRSLKTSAALPGVELMDYDALGIDFSA